MRKTQFKQIRTFVKNNEQTALAKAMQSLDCTADQLTTDHNDKTFVFNLKESAGQSSDNGAGTDEVLAKYPFGLKSIEKSDANTLQNAVQLAMDHFGTFEGNIKRVEEEEDEEYYVFTKVRG